jgi:cobalt-zinc-cadmium resistance protein CzcA
MQAILVDTPEGAKVPLSQLASFQRVSGPVNISREAGKQVKAVGVFIKGRDMGSVVADMQAATKDLNSKLAEGYYMTWSGEFENQQRASKRLMQVVPVSLLLIFLILFIMFGNVKDAGMVLLNVPFAIIGGIAALYISGTNFSISAGIGFIALFGICIQNGVILISVFKNNLQKIKKSEFTHHSLENAITNGVRARVRPVVMTALMAAIGLMPAALSHGIGSETSRPLAIVVIGGLITATVLTLLVFPLFFYFSYRRVGQKMD